MQLDAGEFRSAEFRHVIDVVDMVVLDDTEHAAHAADDPALLTVVYVAAADDVAADLLLQPSVVLAAADRVALHLGGALYIFMCEVLLVVGIKVFAQRNAGTLAVRNFTVLDDPAFAPVGSDHAVLESCRRRPCCCSFIDFESPGRDIADACFGRHEAPSADIDLHIFLIRIQTLKIGVDDRFIGICILFGIPLVNGIIRRPAVFVNLAFDALFQRRGFVHRLVVQVNAAGMLVRRSKIPSPYTRVVWVVIPKVLFGIWQTQTFPDNASRSSPFCAQDHRAKRRRRHSDTGVFTRNEAHPRILVDPCATSTSSPEAPLCCFADPLNGLQEPCRLCAFAST